MSADKGLQKKLLKAALGEVESLRLKRQHKYSRQPHPALKRFTQQELSDEACQTYKNLLVGRSQRLPDRETMLRIAEYLECTFDERNELLAAAGYLPVQPDMHGELVEQELGIARQLLNTLGMPAMLVAPTLEIKGANELFTDLFDLSPEAISANEINLMDFHFSAELPVRSRATFNKDAFAQWEAHAINGLHAFRRNHLLSRYDDWYQKLLQRLHLHGGEKYWGMRKDEAKPGEPLYRSVLARVKGTNDLVPIRYKQIYLSAGSGRFPGIGVFLPADEAARHVFASIGSSVDYSRLI